MMMMPRPRGFVRTWRGSPTQRVRWAIGSALGTWPDPEGSIGNWHWDSAQYRILIAGFSNDYLKAAHGTLRNQKHRVPAYPEEMPERNQGTRGVYDH